MDTVATIVLWTLYLFLVPNVLYLFFLAAGGLRVKPLPPSGRDYHFIVLIAVHNEEDAVEGLITSIGDCTYESGKVRVVFVADHCTDATTSILRRHSVEVLENSGPDRGKAAAMSMGVRHIMPDLDDYRDLLVVLDADNRLDRHFFEEVAGAMSDSISVAQANTGYANWDATVFTRLNHLNVVVTNRFKDLARSQWGFSSVLRGQGMIFRPSAVRQLSWASNTLAEDREMIAELVLKGSRAVWIQSARLSSIIPDNISSAASQRRRWASAKRDVSRRVAIPLLKAAARNRSLVAFDLAINFLMSSHASLLGLMIGGSVLALFFLGASALLTNLYLGMTGSFLVYFYVASRLERIPFSVFSTFLLSPFFIFWRVWIYLSSLKKVKKWS